MTDEPVAFRLTACRELMESHPESLRIRRQVEALENSLPVDPGVAVSFCRAIIETTCKTILQERGVHYADDWKASKLVKETKKSLGIDDKKDEQKKDQLLRQNLGFISGGIANVVTGISNIRNDFGSAAHGAEAYEPLLDEGYAEILARSTDAIIGFLFRTHKGEMSEPKYQIAYGDKPDFDNRIDGEFGPFIILNSEYSASETLFRVAKKTYLDELLNHEQIQSEDATDGARIDLKEADT